jgi:hypothetical protein
LQNNKKGTKPMNKVYVMVILVIIISLGIVYIAYRIDLLKNIPEIARGIFQNNNQNPNSDSNNNPNRLNQPDSSTDSLDRENEDNPNENTGEGSESGEGDDDSGEQNNQTENYCSQILSYTLLDFSEQEICNTYQGLDCIDKTLNCSVFVQNLDQELGGDFTVRFDFEDKKTKEKIFSTTETQYLSPRQTSQFSRSQNFILPNSNNSLQCKFSTENPPARYIC